MPALPLPLVEVVELVVVVLLPLRREEERQGKDDLVVVVDDDAIVEDAVWPFDSGGGCKCSSGMVKDDGGILYGFYMVFIWIGW